jgi:hypothetical protein
MKTIGIYSGNFQPPTRAHLQIYKKLRQAVGPDTFVVTTDRTPTPEAPLNAGDKEQILVRHGVPASNIQRVNDWKQPEEIFHKFSGEHTAVIFALNPREADEVAKRKVRSSQIKLKELAIAPTTSEPADKEVWVQSDGKPNYFQPYRGNESSMKPFKENAYVMVVDDSKIDGRPVSTANIRQVFGSPRYTDDAKKKFFRFVFGWFDVGLYTLMISKFRSAHQVAAEEEPPLPTEKPAAQPAKVPTAAFRENVKKMVNDILKEIMDEDYSSSSTMSSTLGGDSDTTDMATTLDTEKTPAEKNAEKAKKKADLVNLKQRTERDLDGIQKDLKWKQSDVIRKRKDEIPNKRKELDAINKQIAQPDNSITALS